MFSSKLIIALLTIGAAHAMYMNHDLNEVIPCDSTHIGNFSIASGGTTYLPGSSQLITWARPANESLIKMIKSNVSIADTSLHTIYPHLNATGVPVYFSANETSLDMAGIIEVLIPDTLPDGTSYVFRLIVKAKGCLCYIDSDLFAVQHETPPPTGDCTTLGSLHCTSDLSGFQQCLQNGSALDLGPVIPCADTTHCTQLSENIVTCTSGPVNECTLGESDCLSPTETRTCSLNESGGTVWINSECPVGTSCTGNGICTSTTPSTECFPYHQQCIGNSTFVSCSQDLSTGLWNFGLEVNCPSGSICEVYQTDFVHCIPVV